MTEDDGTPGLGAVDGTDLVDEDGEFPWEKEDGGSNE